MCQWTKNVQRRRIKQWRSADGLGLQSRVCNHGNPIYKLRYDTCSKFIGTLPHCLDEIEFVIARGVGHPLIYATSSPAPPSEARAALLVKLHAVTGARKGCCTCRQTNFQNTDVADVTVTDDCTKRMTRTKRITCNSHGTCNIGLLQRAHHRSPCNRRVCMASSNNPYR
jgi:hypothetical protein